MAQLMTQCPIRWQAIHHGQRIALQSDQVQVTYSQLDQLVSQLHTQLISQINTSLPPMTRLVCIADNSLELVLLQLLCIRLGWCFCPLNPRFSDAEITQRMDIINSEYCWVSEHVAHQRRRSLRLTITLENNHAVESLSPLTINPTQPCSLIFTSGSSGFPKAIVHHYQNHFYSAQGSQLLIPLIATDHNLLSLPLFHIGGYATVIRTVLAGASLHLSHAPLNLKLLQQRTITHLSLVSTQLIRLLAEPQFQRQQSKIRHILLGGSSFPSSLLNALQARQFDYHLSYGCTEMASQVATSTNNDRLQVLPYRDVKVHEGNVYLRGETRFIGYFEQNQLTLIPPQQWIDIADTGALKGKQLSITGRKDRQFISGGENVIPEEIERVCLQQETVKQAYVCPVNHTEYGQRIAVFVAFFDTDLSFETQQQSLQQAVANQLTRFKQPDHYFPWPETGNSQVVKIPRHIFQETLKNKGLI